MPNSKEIRNKSMRGISVRIATEASREYEKLQRIENDRNECVRAYKTNKKFQRDLCIKIDDRVQNESLVNNEIIANVCLEISCDPSQRLTLIEKWTKGYKILNNITGPFSKADFLVILYNEFIKRKQTLDSQDADDDFDIG